MNNLYFLDMTASDYSGYIRQMLKAYFEYANRPDVKAYQNADESKEAPGQPSHDYVDLPIDFTFREWLPTQSAILNTFGLRWDKDNSALVPNKEPKMLQFKNRVMSADIWLQYYPLEKKWMIYV